MLSAAGILRRSSTAAATDRLGKVARTCYDAIGWPTATIDPIASAAGVSCASPAPAAHTTYRYLGSEAVA